MAEAKRVLSSCLLVLLVCGYEPATAAPPQEAGGRPTAPARLPGGVPHWSGANINYYRPPSGFHAAVVWMQTVHDTSQRGDGWIEVDWMRLYATVGGKDLIVARDEYTKANVCGGLYARYPWFGSDKHQAMPAAFDASGGLLVLRPSRVPRQVFHWWNCQRGVLPAKTEACWGAARVRIHGTAAVQAGIDYWKNAHIGYGGTERNNKEAASTKWYFASPDWQIIPIARRQ